MKKTFIKSEIVDTWGKYVVVYTDPEMKIIVKLYRSKKDEYWWVKIGNAGGPGNDGNLNMANTHAAVLADILNDIRQEYGVVGYADDKQK